MGMLRMLISLATIAMLINFSMAATYTVGSPNGGWDTSTDLKTWTGTQSFKVGDNLVFTYTPNHDVLEVTKANYDSCQTSNPILTDTTGSVTIPLSSPGKRYFICGTNGHCSQGMKLEINTLATTSSPPPASPSTPPPASPSTPPPASPASPPPVSPSAPPTASPVSPPVSSPPPKGSPPVSAPKISPSSPPESPKSSPTPTSNIPSTESPSNSPPPSPSSAYKSSFQVTSAMGFCFMIMISLAL